MRKLCLLAALCGCGSSARPTSADLSAPGDGGALDLPTGLVLPTEFTRFCQGKDWTATLTPAKVGELKGNFRSVVKNRPDKMAPTPLPAGTQEMMKMIP